MQWPRMSQAVLAVAPSAWPVSGKQSADEVTAEATVEGNGNEKPPVSKEETGGAYEREKGFARCLAVNPN